MERRKDGIVVPGARLLSTLAPVANEVIVGPYQPRLPGENDKCLLFSLPMNAKGLTILRREPYSEGRSVFDWPLTSRYDEGDAILIFDDVFVPDERVAIAGDIGAFNGILMVFPELHDHAGGRPLHRQAPLSRRGGGSRGARDRPRQVRAPSGDPG